MLVRIEAFDLPGLECGGTPGMPQYRDIHVGVQRRDRPGEILGLRPGDAADAVWGLEATATAREDGWDIRGPYVQGRPGGRFIYLSWGTGGTPGTFEMFRRAKLWLDGVPPDVLDAAVHAGRLTGRLALTDARGEPLCATVRPPLITWTAQ